MHRRRSVVPRTNNEKTCSLAPNPASYPDVSLLMKMFAQRKAGRRQRARRLADLVFNMAARVMADQYAVF